MARLGGPSAGEARSAPPHAPSAATAPRAKPQAHRERIAARTVAFGGVRERSAGALACFWGREGKPALCSESPPAPARVASLQGVSGSGTFGVRPGSALAACPARGRSSAMPIAYQDEPQAVPWLAKHDLAYYGPFRYAPTPLVVTSAGSNREKGSTLEKWRANRTAPRPRLRDRSDRARFDREGRTVGGSPRRSYRFAWRDRERPRGGRPLPRGGHTAFPVARSHSRRGGPFRVRALLRFRFFPHVFFSRDARRLARSSHPSPLALLARPPSFQLSSPGITSVRS